MGNERKKGRSERLALGAHAGEEREGSGGEDVNFGDCVRSRQGCGEEEGDESCEAVRSWVARLPTGH